MTRKYVRSARYHMYFLGIMTAKILQVTDVWQNLCTIIWYLEKQSVGAQF